MKVDSGNTVKQINLVGAPNELKWLTRDILKKIKCSNTWRIYNLDRVSYIKIFLFLSIPVLFSLPIIFSCHFRPVIPPFFRFLSPAWFCPQMFYLLCYLFTFPRFSSISSSSFSHLNLCHPFLLVCVEYSPTSTILMSLYFFEFVRLPYFLVRSIFNSSSYHPFPRHYSLLLLFHFAKSFSPKDTAINLLFTLALICSWNFLTIFSTCILSLYYFVSSRHYAVYPGGFLLNFLN